MADTKKGHPKGLYLLFFTEMWERFSFYGMRSLLVLYMVNYLFVHPDVANRVFGFSTVRAAFEFAFGPLQTQPLASQIYGMYTAFAYLTPLFGGMLADRFLGQRKSVVVGGILMAIGHFLMAVESLFFPALLCIACGNGCFKPNISTQVGSLYEPNDPRRERAFTIFYMGINLGAFFSPLICGTLGQKVGWHYGFAAAGVGMIVGLTLYLYGQKHLAPDNVMRTKAGEVKKEALTTLEKRGIWALVALCALNIVFWAVYEQQGNTIQLWADKNTDWHLLGFEIPSSWYQSFNPLMIFAFIPLINMLWAGQANRKKEPSSVTKMALGCLLLGAAFVIMIPAAFMNQNDSRGNVLWLVATSVVLTVGEIYLSPIGLSLVTKVAPARLVSMMMGMWFLSSFFGNYLSGWLGMYYEKMPKEMYFGLMGALAATTGLAIWLFNKPLRAALNASVTAKGAAPTT